MDPVGSTTFGCLKGLLSNNSLGWGPLNPENQHASPENTGETSTQATPKIPKLEPPADESKPEWKVDYLDVPLEVRINPQ